MSSNDSGIEEAKEFEDKGRKSSTDSGIDRRLEENNQKNIRKTSNDSGIESPIKTGVYLTPVVSLKRLSNIFKVLN